MGHTTLLLREIDKVGAEIAMYIFGYNLTRSIKIVDTNELRSIINKHNWSIGALFVINSVIKALILQFSIS
jgi:hypothetical protein